MNARSLAVLLAPGWVLFAAAPYARAEDEPVPIYGQELMSEQEKERYRARNRAVRSPKERAALRKQHRKQMQERAREHGVETPIFGGRLMSAEERKQFRAQMQAAKTDEERAQLRAQHRKRMRARARERRKQTPDVAAPATERLRVPGVGVPRMGRQGPGDAEEGLETVEKDVKIVEDAEAAQHQKQRAKGDARKRPQTRREKREEMVERHLGRDPELSDEN